jgi:glutathione S-transferase
VSATLYVILGSHAGHTGRLLLAHKGIEHRTVTLPTGLHPLLLRFAGFRADGLGRPVDGRTPTSVKVLDSLGTIPALELDGEKVQTNMAIARHLDAVRPARPLFPADPGRRREVEEAERWGDQELQMRARRLAAAAGRRGDGDDEGRLGPLLSRSPLARRAIIESVAMVFAVDEQAEARLEAELPATLDRVDAWIDAGVLNADELTAADYMIVTSLALLCYCPAYAAQVEGRPAARLLARVFGR